MSDAAHSASPAAPGFRWIALGIVAFAGALRLWALDFGLPHLEARPDETETLRLTLEAAQGRFDFDWAIYPHAYAYLQWIWAEIALRAQAALGLVAGHDMLRIFDEEPERLYLVGRAASALGGTATVAVVLATARRELGPVAALIAGVWLAVNLLHVRESHALKPDVLLTLGLACCLPAAVALARRPGWRSAVVAGAAVGAAGAMKYNGVLGALPVCVGAWMADGGSRGLRRWLPPTLWIAGASAVVVFVATSPFLPFNRAAQDVIQSNLNAVFPAWIPAPSDGGIDTSSLEGPGLPDWVAPYGGLAVLVYHFAFSLWYGAGVLATFLAPCAIANGLVRRSVLLRASAVGVVGWLAVVSVSPVTLSRYVTPMLPALAILEAALLVAIARRLAPSRAGALAAVLAAAVLAQPLVASVRFDRLAARDDTRAEAHRWLARNAGGGRVAVVGTRFWHWGAPRLPAGVQLVILPPPVASAERPIDPRSVDWIVAHDHELWWSELPPGFLARNRDRLELVVDLDPRAGATGLPVFEHNDAFYLPIAGFSGVTVPGPRVRIYRVR